MECLGLGLEPDQSLAVDAEDKVCSPTCLTIIMNHCESRCCIVPNKIDFITNIPIVLSDQASCLSSCMWLPVRSFLLMRIKDCFCDFYNAFPFLTLTHSSGSVETLLMFLN